MTKLLYLLLLTGVLARAQQPASLRGRVVAGNALVTGVFVINKRTGNEVKTDSRGAFAIGAQPGDRIVVYGTQIEVREFVLSAAAFAGMPYDLEVKPKAYELDEVVVNDINPEALGLVPKGQKQYTVAERRLKAASEFHPTFTFMLGGGLALPLDAIINEITGRTKMLRKALATERKEMNMEMIADIYTEEQLTSKLSIPAEMVPGFLFYAVEDPGFIDALRHKNNDLGRLILMELSKKYLSLQQEGTSTPIERPHEK